MGLVALSARAYGAGGRTELSFDPVAAAIASHDSGGAARPAPAAQQVLASRASQGPSLSNMKSWSVSEHPWDVSPEGMPTANGQLISAAQMFADAGEPAPQPARGGNTLGLRTVAQAKAEANRRMAGGGSGDPDVSLDLEEVFAQHDAGDETAAVQQTAARTAAQARASQRAMDQGLEAQRQARALAAKEQEQARERQAAQLALQRERDAVPQARASSVQAGGAQAPAGKVVGSGDSAAKIRAKLAAEGKNQGFTGNMHLRVSPQEFKREMERYMPDANGRLVSPYEWFQKMGQ